MKSTHLRISLFLNPPGDPSKIHVTCKGFLGCGGEVLIPVPADTHAVVKVLELRKMLSHGIAVRGEFYGLAQQSFVRTVEVGANFLAY